MDASRYPRKDKILQDMLKINQSLRRTTQKLKTEQDRAAAKKIGKQTGRRRRFLKRKCVQDKLNKEKEAGRAPSGGKRALYMDATALFTDKDPKKELTTYYESLFNVKWHLHVSPTVRGSFAGGAIRMFLGISSASSLTFSLGGVNTVFLPILASSDSTNLLPTYPDKLRPRVLPSDEVFKSSNAKFSLAVHTL